MSVAPDQAAYAWMRAFVDELARAGVRHCCISPGSRSTPLALTVASDRRIRVWTHVDERSGAFFALGMARASSHPVALVCTSGTAAANFLPAIAEARMAGVPLIVLTADRPHELRDSGAAQTIDQNRLFGVHAKWFVDVAIPEATPAMLRYARVLGARAVAHASELPAGPVHLNFPLREPLVPRGLEPPAGLAHDDQLAWTGRPDGAPWVRTTESERSLDDAAVAQVAKKLRDARRPLIVCGPQYDPALAAPLSRLAAAIGAPLLADPLSQLRWGSHDRAAIVDRYDAFLRHTTTAESLAPDLIVRFGGVPTSKVTNQYLERQAAPVVVVAPAHWPDPGLSASEMIRADPRLLAERALDRVGAGAASSGSSWLQRWQTIDDAAGRALACHSEKLPGTFEGRVLADVVAALPSPGTLFVSSSMPVRDLDAFAAGDTRELRMLANRGANGIDGVVSSALGAAAANPSPLVLVIGDLALYHDMNGLLAARLHAIDATIVVVNNDGGGIFSFLSQAAHPEHFETLFGTPTGLDVAKVAALYDAGYTRVDAPGSLQTEVVRAIGAGGLNIIEVRTDRASNVVLHRDAWAAVAQAVAGV